MALPSILSPMKAGMSPLSTKVNAIAGSSASSAKRSLQQGFSAAISTCSAAAALGLNSSSSPAPKRLEHDALFGPPVTPLSSEPGLLQPALTGLQHQQQQLLRQQHQHQPPRQPLAPLQQRVQSAMQHHHQQQQQQQQRAFSSSSPAADTDAAADQLPSPFEVLEVPPECEQAAPAANSAAAGGDSGVAAAMSGRRVAARYDIPLGFDWAHGQPDHCPALGEGRLELIMGPMFAGKTTRLISRVQEVCAADNKLAVAVKSSEDRRYGCHWVVTHDGRCMRCFTAASLSEFRAHMGATYHKLQVIAVDEAQFFPDLLQFCKEAVDTDGKHVIVAGLSGDFRRRRFGQLMDLLPLADSITQLSSKCNFCGDRALFSLRLVDGGPLALVGGEDKYRATCRRCYLAHSGVMQ